MIEFRQVTKRFTAGPAAVTALADIDLTITDREIFGVVGESGSGKSTLLRLVNHLEAPSEGTVTVDGVDLAALQPREQRARRQQIGMVFQQFNLLANLTVEDNVALPLRLRRHRDRAIVAEMLEFVGMSGHRRQHPARLSGGEKQRVAIARALASRPRILLCDEPTSALDVGHAEEVMGILRQVREEFGTTIVLVSHDLEVVKTSCDRAAVLDGGRLAALTAVTPPPPQDRAGTYPERARRYLA